MRGLGGIAGALALLVCAASIACVTDAPAPAPLPVVETERARELTFLYAPASRTLTSEAYQAEESAEGRDISDSYVSYMHETYGRLGFFPADYDLRAVRGSQASLFAAYYSSETKLITLIGSPTPSVVVHELVHALQDQHFDLTALYDENVSSDENMALRAIVEGDAVMSEYRYEIQAQGGLPARTLAPYITVERARSTSERVLREVPGPGFFKAYPAFAYSYGAAYVATLLEIAGGSWRTRNTDAMFRAGGPSTTREVMRGRGEKGIQAVPVGLSRLPPELISSYDVDTVDRLGAWYTYLLFYPYEAPDALLALAPAWRGDQFLVLRARDASIPPKEHRPRGVMWTSSWENEAKAGEAHAHLARIHGAIREPDAGANFYRAKDGEPIWLGYVGSTLVFIKNFAPEVMRILARAVFETRDEKRLRILSQYARDPRVADAVCTCAPPVRAHFVARTRP